MNKSGFAWCILLALAFTGCEGDQEGKHHFDNKVFISAASYTPEVRVMRDALDVTEEHTCEITVAMAQPVAQDITVSFAEAPELLDRYRGQLRIMGGFDEIQLGSGREAIKAYMESLVPYVERGGYIPFCDPRRPPNVDENDYLYYLDLKQRMFGLDSPMFRR